MKDETIAEYPPAAADRRVFLTLAPLFLGAAAVLGWFSGPFFLPWGLLLAAGLVFGAVVLRRPTVVWTSSHIGFRGQRKVALAQITRIDVNPGAAVTTVYAGRSRLRVSHRLSGASELLARLGALQPRSGPPEVFLLRPSPVRARFLGALGLVSAAAGAVLASWHFWLGLVFFAAAAYSAAYILWRVPRLYKVGAGLTTFYRFRRPRVSNPAGARCERFRRKGVDYVRVVDADSNVVLDESLLRDPLQPWGEEAALALRPPS